MAGQVEAQGVGCQPSDVGAQDRSRAASELLTNGQPHKERRPVDQLGCRPPVNQRVDKPLGQLRVYKLEAQIGEESDSYQDSLDSVAAQVRPKQVAIATDLGTQGFPPERVDDKASALKGWAPAMILWIG